MSQPTTPLLDRMLGHVWPQQAAARATARAQVAAMQDLADQLQHTGTGVAHASAESGGSPGARRWHWGPPALDARRDTLGTITLQRGQSRALARTNPIAAGAIATNRDRVVGTGLALSAQPNAAVLGWSPEKAQAWKANVHAEFSLWADSTDCDHTHTQNFYELQALVLTAVLESGDTFTLLPTAPATREQPYGLRLQVIEADRVGNPQGKADTATEAAGIRFTSGAPTAAHVYDQHPGSGLLGNSLTGQWVTLVGPSGRRRLLHHLRKNRPDQPRGVPYLAPVVDAIKNLGDYADAEIKAAVISAYFTVFIERENDGGSPLGGDATAPGEPASVAMGAGAVVDLEPGEKINIANPNRPNPNFEAFVLGVVGQIGMALGLPRELLMKQFNASYSASKAALLDAWMYFRNVRTWLARSFCQPVYETWLAEAVALGRVEAPGFFSDPILRWAYTRAAWPGDSMGSINPKDEVAAYSAAIDARLVSRERAEWELFGTDWQETFDGKRTEHQMLKAADMLPAPKAGAAAPVSTGSNPESPAP